MYVLTVVCAHYDVRDLLSLPTPHLKPVHTGDKVEFNQHGQKSTVAGLTVAIKRINTVKYFNAGKKLRKPAVPTHSLTHCCA